MKNVFENKISGFTLVELLVVVLIIGILAAIALPQYQTAVNKSRYAGLMPMAKAVKEAEEAMIMTTGDYTDQFVDLSIEVPGSISQTGKEVNNPDGTTVVLFSNGVHDYVKATKTGLKNNYVMYFDKSPNFPGGIHCEADKNDERAKQICLSYGPINPTEPKTGTSKQYLAYILYGPESGQSASGGKEQVGPSTYCLNLSYYPCSRNTYDDGTYGETSADVNKFWDDSTNSHMARLVLGDGKISFTGKDGTKTGEHDDVLNGTISSFTWDYTFNPDGTLAYARETYYVNGNPYKVSYNADGSVEYLRLYNQNSEVIEFNGSGQLVQSASGFTQSQLNAIGQLVPSYAKSGPITQADLETQYCTLDPSSGVCQ